MTICVCLLAILAFGGFIVPVKSQGDIILMDEILSYITKKLEEDYEKESSPFVADGKKVTMLTSLNIKEIRSISAIERHFKTRLVLSLQWKDSRLAYANIVKIFPGQKLEVPLTARDEFMHMFWRPDITFSPVREALFHAVAIPNAVLIIDPDGTVTFKGRYSFTFACPQNLYGYPFDVQVCHIEIFSLNSKMEVELQWDENAPGGPVKLPENRRLGSFTLVGDARTIQDCEQTIETEFKTEPTALPCVRMEISLERNYAYFVINAFIPSSFVVFVSWVGLWIPSDSIPGRVTIGATCTLAIAIQALHGGLSQPRTPYAKSIDIWMAACFTLVSFTLVEFAMVQAVLAKEVKKCTAKQSKVLELNQAALRSATSGQIMYNINEYISGQLFSNEHLLSVAIDKHSRMFFPAAYFVFAFLFTVVYVILGR